MPSQSILHTKRQVTRSKKTAEVVLGAPEGQWAALKTIAPDLLEKGAAFEAADAEVRRIEVQSKQEVAEGLEALAPVARAYDGARMVVDNKMGTAHPGSTTFATPDDLLTAVYDLIDQLEPDEGTEAEPWTAELTQSLSLALEVAAKEQSEASQVLKALQKAQLERETAAQALRPAFVLFRRLVRVAFGPSSREYRELRDRRGRGSDDDTGEVEDVSAVEPVVVTEQASAGEPAPPADAVAEG